MYQLATDRNGFHRCPRLNTTSGLGRSSAAIGRVLRHPHKRQRVPLAHAVVRHRQHVRPPQAEDQQHLHRPGADAAHLGEPLHDIRVRHLHDGGSAMAPCRRASWRRGPSSPWSCCPKRRRRAALHRACRAAPSARDRRRSIRAPGDGSSPRPFRATAGTGSLRAAIRTAKAARPGACVNGPTRSISAPSLGSRARKMGDALRSGSKGSLRLRPSGGMDGVYPMAQSPTRRPAQFLIHCLSTLKGLGAGASPAVFTRGCVNRRHRSPIRCEAKNRSPAVREPTTR